MIAGFDPAIASTYEQALAQVGQWVTVQRVSGTAPRTAAFSATVRAVVRDRTSASEAASRTGYSASGVGGITQDARWGLVLAADLAAARFPLPLRKNDKLILESGDKLNIAGVDAEKRRLAGAIELELVGVQ